MGTERSAGRWERWARFGLDSWEGVPDCGCSLLAKDRLEFSAALALLTATVGELMVRLSPRTERGFDGSRGRVCNVKSVCERAARGVAAAGLWCAGVVELRPELAALLRRIRSSR